MRRHMVDLIHEEFWILLTGRSQNVLARELISKGGLSEVLVDVKIVFSLALQYKAANIFLIHNHPSGNLKPSQQDINLTKRIIDAGRILDIKILDHLIITDQGYYSLADEGII
jgi:DNA repair protein RadC